MAIQNPTTPALLIRVQAFRQAGSRYRSSDIVQNSHIRGPRARAISDTSRHSIPVQVLETPIGPRSAFAGRGPISVRPKGFEPLTF